MKPKLIPGASAPALQFETVAHGSYDVATDVPAGGTLLVFHRGSHCKWTRLMLKELDDRIGDFALRGIRVVAVSGEDHATCAALADKMQLVRLPLGYGLNVTDVAADWGLWLTADSTEDDAPPLHWEAAQIWMRADGRLGGVAVQSAPNLWADATNLIRAIEKTMNDFPERGAGA